MMDSCYPVTSAVGENFLEDTARALCERPNETAEKGASRTIQMVHTVLSMSPRDGLEVVISTMAYGHHAMILDSMRDVHHSQDLADKRKAKAEIIALDRSFLGLMREYRIHKARPEATDFQPEAAFAAQTQAATQAQAQAPAQPAAAHPSAAHPAAARPAAARRPAAQPAPAPAQAQVKPAPADDATGAPDAAAPAGEPVTGARTAVPPAAPLADPVATAPADPVVAPLADQTAGSAAAAQPGGSQPAAAQPVRPVNRP